MGRQVCGGQLQVGRVGMGTAVVVGVVVVGGGVGQGGPPWQPDLLPAEDIPHVKRICVDDAPPPFLAARYGDNAEEKCRSPLPSVDVTRQ